MTPITIAVLTFLVLASLGLILSSVPDTVRRDGPGGLRWVLVLSILLGALALAGG